MLNRSGISRETATNVTQILANTELQSSVGCIVPATLGVTVGAKKIAKAGTPININLDSTSTAVAAVASGKPMNAVLLHDVDVTSGAQNGTALIFGFINKNRLEADVKTKVTSALAISGASPLLVFMTV